MEPKVAPPTPERPGQDKQCNAVVISTDLAVPLSKDVAPDSAFDIVLHLQDDSGETHLWRGEFSDAYGKGIYADKTRAELTVETLERVGWTGGMNVGDIDKMVGMSIPISVKYNLSNDGTRWYKNVYLGSGGIRKIEKAKALDIIARIAGAKSNAAKAPAASYDEDPFK